MPLIMQNIKSKGSNQSKEMNTCLQLYFIRIWTKFKLQFIRDSHQKNWKNFAH